MKATNINFILKLKIFFPYIHSLLKRKLNLNFILIFFQFLFWLLAEILVEIIYSIYEGRMIYIENISNFNSIIMVSSKNNFLSATNSHMKALRLISIFMAIIYS